MEEGNLMGILDEAGVVATDVPKDPFGFGNDYWPVVLLEINPPKIRDEDGSIIEYEPGVLAGVSSTGKSYGTNMVWAVLDARYEYLGNGTGKLGFGQWFQLPAPKSIQHQVPFDKNSAEGKKLIYDWGILLKGLGFAADEMGAAGLQDIIGREALAKIYPKQDPETGFWSFRVVNHKQPAKGEGTNSGTPAGNSSTSGLSAIDLAIRADLENA